MRQHVRHNIKVKDDLKLQPKYTYLSVLIGFSKCTCYNRLEIKGRRTDINRGECFHNNQTQNYMFSSPSD